MQPRMQSQMVASSIAEEGRRAILGTVNPIGARYRVVEEMETAMDERLSKWAC